MTDCDRLLRVVLEQPDEDTPRLELADALDESGKPAAAARAELIRVQVESARCGPCPMTIYHLSELQPEEHPWKRGGPPLIEPKEPCGWCPVCLLPARAEALLKKWGARWLPASGRKVARFRAVVVGGRLTVGRTDHYRAEYAFSRGFVSEMTTRTCAGPSGPDGRKCGLLVRELLSAHPLERAVFAWEGHEPEVRVRFVHTGYDWMVLAEAGDVIRDGEVLVRQGSYFSRAAMLRHAPDLLGRFFGEIAFTENVPSPIPT